MGPQTARFCSRLQAIRALLERHGVDHWAQWIASDLAEIERGDLHGVEHFLSALGGMGSLSDLIISPANGHRIDESETVRVNRELERLTSEAWELASAIRRVADAE